MLLEFAAQHKLIVANSLFKKNKDRYWTWEAPMEIRESNRLYSQQPKRYHPEL